MTDRALRYVPNSTQVMDVYFDKYMALLTGAEWKTLCYAIRRIFGFKRESDWISLDQFVNGIVKRDGTRLDNGTGMARGTVVKALDFLKKVHLLQTRGVLGSTPEYSLNLDPELIDHKTLNKRQAETVKGNHQKVAKARKHNPRVGVSVQQKTDTRSVPQDAPRSVPQDTQESVNQQSADNSSELGVPNSTELAENVSTHLSAAPVLNPAEREILRACADGVVIAHYHNTEAANHLIALGMIERCQCGAKDVLCSKGKCPTHDKPCPDDVKVNELQTALQQSFLPGSNGNQPETVVTPSPQTPLPQSAPAALPVVPEGYEAMYGFGGTNSEFRHYRPIGKKRTLCAAHHPYSKPVNNLNFVHQCPDCAAKAAARPATAKKAKPKKGKPALRQPDKDIKDYLATLMFGGTDIVGGSWALVVKAWNAVDCPELAKVKRFGAWWPNHWPGNKGEKPSLALIKTHWDTAMNDTTKEAADDAYYAKMDTDDGWMFDNVGKEQP